jgi:hypothetical protein
MIMASANLNSRRSRQQTFDLTTILDGIRQPEYVHLVNADDGELHNGDYLLVDRLRRPRKGDWVVWSEDNQHHICRYESAAKTGEIYAVVVSLIRDFRKIKRPKSQDRKISQLNDALARLERVPENEAERFRLETEIFKLGHVSDMEEWPDVIGVQHE